jgi:hypothetical protein
MQLRSGISIDDLLNLMIALEEGIALRSIGNPSSNLINHDRRRSLLGTAFLALIYSVTERTEEADGMTLEEAVRTKVYPRNGE